MSIIIYILFQKTNIVKKKPFQKNPFTLKAKTSRSHVSFITVYVKGFPFLCMLLQIFLFGCQPASDMSLRLIDIQHNSCTLRKYRVNLFQSFRHIFVHSGFGYSEFFSGLSYRSILFDNIICDFNCAFFNIRFQRLPAMLFLHCMKKHWQVCLNKYSILTL